MADQALSARDVAELAGAKEVTFPPAALSSEDPIAVTVMSRERVMFHAHHDLLTRQSQLVDQRIAQAHEQESGASPQFEILADTGPDVTPRAVVCDKGYDAKANRKAARRRGIMPVIPYLSNVKDQPAHFPKLLYRARARIEQLIGKLKRFKRVAMLRRFHLTGLRVHLDQIRPSQPRLAV